MATKESGAARIVISLNPCEPRDYALEITLSALPSRLRQFLGLYVENQSLMEHARSRHAREVRLTGPQRELNPVTIERQIRAEARRARTLFEAAGTRLGMDCRFETARGDILLEPIRRAAGAQALVLSIAQTEEIRISRPDFLRQLFETGPPLVLIARPGWLSGRSVAVLVRDAEDSLLDIGARVAAQTDSPLFVLLRPGQTDDRERIVRGLLRRLHDQGIEKSGVVFLDSPSVESIAATVRSHNTRLLVMRSPSESEDADISELMRRYSGALMMVRS